MTWSVSSTKAIFIVPSGTSATATRSTRRVTRSRRPKRSPRSDRREPSRRGAGRLEAGGPFRLEQVAQVVAGGVERDARDDRFQEAEDDELSGLDRRDAATLE